jgi:hypothetical protein
MVGGGRLLCISSVEQLKMSSFSKEKKSWKNNCFKKFTSYSLRRGGSYGSGSSNDVLFFGSSIIQQILLP